MFVLSERRRRNEHKRPNNPSTVDWWSLRRITKATDYVRLGLFLDEFMHSNSLSIHPRISRMVIKQLGETSPLLTFSETWDVLGPFQIGTRGNVFMRGKELV